jgi:hypothetical protein
MDQPSTPAKQERGKEDFKIYFVIAWLSNMDIIFLHFQKKTLLI